MLIFNFTFFLKLFVIHHVFMGIVSQINVFVILGHKVQLVMNVKLDIIQKMEIV